MSERVRPWRVYGPLLLAAGVVLALDQVTKELALDALSGGRTVRVVDGVVELRLALNPGGAFGILKNAPGFFLVSTVFVVGLILVWARRLERHTWATPLGLVLGGGLGNLYDRVFRDFGGRVVDFIDLQVWPVFNLADSAIVVGVAAIVLLSLPEKDRGDGSEPIVGTDASGR